MMPRMRTSCCSARWAAIGLALGLAACTSLERPPVASVDTANALASQGDSAGAARVYESLARDNAEPARSAFLLRAAAAWLRAGLPDSAEAALTATATSLSAAEAFQRGLLLSEIALDRGQGTAAYAALAALPQPDTGPEAIRYLALRERAAFASGRPIDGVRAEIEREKWLPTAPARLDSRIALLRELRESLARGARVQTESPKDPVVRGWLEVGMIAATVGEDSGRASPELNAWSGRYPSHPAQEVVRAQLVSPPPPAVEPGAVIAHIAVLLPLSGPLASAASSVRDGFFTASNRIPEANRPVIRVYDTNATSVGDAIARANAEGAEFIVGPLTREELLAASDYSGARPPMLALNFLPAERPAPDNFYQFALSPEDEARQVARKLLAQGERRGIALAPAGDWGDRVLAAFSEELIAGGGQVLARATLDPGKSDFSASITEALRLSDSKARHRRIEGVLGTTLAFEPRRRADVEFIFAASQPAMARLLRPQLRFHYAGDIPTYATSDAYDPNPAANADIDGLLFPEMPWMLGTGPLSQDVREESKDGSAGGAPRRGRLFAFGFDAYNLVAALRGGALLELQGLTGTLTLGPDKRVRRELSWARIKDGHAELIVTAMN